MGNIKFISVETKYCVLYNKKLERALHPAALNFDWGQQLIRKLLTGN